MKNVDLFETASFDDQPVQLIVRLGDETAAIYVPGLIFAWVGATMPKDQAFDLLHEAPVLTYAEIRNRMAPFQDAVALN
jgi:hypothetical protein